MEINENGTVVNEPKNSDDEWEWFSEKSEALPPGVFKRKKVPKPEPVVNWMPNESFNRVRDMKHQPHPDPNIHLK